MALPALNPEGELDALVDILPPALQPPVRAVPGDELLEVVLDLGRLPEARLASRTVVLAEAPVTDAELEHVLSHLSPLGEDNRAGIERTLHRVSAIRNRRGRVIGITLRVGRAMLGTIEVIQELVESGRSLLLLGRPGVGKTTRLREIARVLADDLHKRVMVIDTSNEIGGDGDIPHPAIGGARRMQVARPELQHAVMIEAVENHMPEVIIVDEIGTAQEALAARTIAERGVQLVATAHGNTLENLVLNPTLSDLVGGVHQVTLSDEEARRRGTLKTVSERRAPPTFDVVVELVNRDEVVVHKDTARAVDALLSGRPPGGERRRRAGDRIEVEPEPDRVAELDGLNRARPESAGAEGAGTRATRVHIYGVGRQVIDRVMRTLGADIRIVARPENAEELFVLRSRSGEPRIRRLLERPGAKVHYLKRASASELRKALRNAFVSGVSGADEAEAREALEEAELAIHRALNEGVSIPLSPRPPRLRRLQHQLVERFHLQTMSVGSGDERHLVIYPEGADGLRAGE
ncbi:MAG: AAA family ATPase [Myxococcaceae bacterium]|nr:AAA family ATPase [Myxococcaceae bacterium]